MKHFLWPSDDGWPYPDESSVNGLRERDDSDFASEIDDDSLSLRLELTKIRRAGAHLFDGLDPVETQVILRKFGLDGGPERTLNQLQLDLGVPSQELGRALESGLGKLRVHLSA